MKYKVRIKELEHQYYIKLSDVESGLESILNDELKDGWEFVSMTTNESFNDYGNCNERKCIMVFKQEEEVQRG